MRPCDALDLPPPRPPAWADDEAERIPPNETVRPICKKIQAVLERRLCDVPVAPNCWWVGRAEEVEPPIIVWELIPAWFLPSACGLSVAPLWNEGTWLCGR
jgi:hypothetical protein